MTSYKIGLDFGTTNSIISYLEGERLVAFRYGTPGQQEEYVPSFVAYDGEIVEIGTAARTTAVNHPAAQHYANFKMRLPLPEGNFERFFTPPRSPMSVTADYLHELLVSSDNPYSFCSERGEIAALVVSVPEIWQRDIYNLGRSRLQKLIRELGLPLVQLISEPVAAAAYYAWEITNHSQDAQEGPFCGNLLVCDMGGGTFDVSLCRLHGNQKVEVLYFDGQGEGLASAGVAFDRRCVQLAWAKKHGQPLEENDPEFLRLLREFELVKLATHPKMLKKFANYLKLPDAYTEQIAYIFAGGYGVSFGEVRQAFAEIAQTIGEVMARIQAWLEHNQETIDRLFLVGGFSQFPLVQRAILEALAMEESDPRYRRFNLVSSTYAISYGACLIANGLIDPTERYVHTLGITINREIAIAPAQGEAHLEIQEEAVTLIPGGTGLNQLELPRFYHQPLVAWQASFPVPIWVDPRTRGKRFKQFTPEQVSLPNFSPSAQYRVGMRVDASQVAYLVIEEINSAARLEYELGNLIAQMFPGFVLSESGEVRLKPDGP
ncbi:MAG: Hsp70 family protein [Chloroflexaceae bacterium]|nr:Hsp70 family protein [Chloroflexaceae bacterium]